MKVFGHGVCSVLLSLGGGFEPLRASHRMSEERAAPSPTSPCVSDFAEGSQNPNFQLTYSSPGPKLSSCD